MTGVNGSGPEPERVPFVVPVAAKPAGRLPGGAQDLRHVGKGTTRGGRPFNVWVFSDGVYPHLQITVDDQVPPEAWRLGLTSLVHSLLDADPTSGVPELATAIASLRAILAVMPIALGDGKVATGLDMFGRALDAVEAFAVDWMTQAAGDPPKT